MPDKGRLLSSDGQQIATVYYDIYPDFTESDGRRLVGEFHTDTSLDETKGYIIELQNSLKLDCFVGLCKPAPSQGAPACRYRLYI